MLNQFMRYVPLAHLVKKERCGRILEIGGGVNGINRYLSGTHVTGVDIKFNDTVGIGNDKFIPINGSAQNLKFEDNSFPIVVCSDVLEHIEQKDRESVIRELWRVASRKIYLSFPVSETYGKWEERLVRAYELFKIDRPDWLDEHLAKGLPEEASIATLLIENKMPFTVVPNENNLVHFLIMLAEASPFSKYLNFISDAISPETWDGGAHSSKENIIRAVFLPFRQLPRFLSFGSPVRKIFIITKNADSKDSENADIAGYYDTHPRMMSSPFGGVNSTHDADNGYLTETLSRFNVDLRDKKVLDVGCGAGWFARYCKGVVRSYTGVDISSAAVAICRGITPNIIQADSQDLPFSPGSFDYVFCVDSFEHVPDQYKAACEFYRVLGKDGKVFLSVPNYSNVAGIVKKFEEGAGFYEKDSWAPFDRWSCQVLEQFVTPKRVKSIFGKAGFKKFSVVGGRLDLLDGVFPWINHRWMPYPDVVRNLFLRIQKPLERFHWLSLHNFWLIER